MFKWYLSPHLYFLDFLILGSSSTALGGLSGGGVGAVTQILNHKEYELLVIMPFSGCTCQFIIKIEPKNMKKSHVFLRDHMFSSHMLTCLHYLTASLHPPVNQSQLFLSRVVTVFLDPVLLAQGAQIYHSVQLWHKV